MSHAAAEAIYNGQRLGFLEYDGTADVLGGYQLWSTLQELNDHWRAQPWPECTCATAQILPVLFYTNYSGFYWPGSVCAVCRVVVDPGEPRDPDQAVDGHPPHQPEPCEIDEDYIQAVRSLPARTPMA